MIGGLCGALVVVSLFAISQAYFSYRTPCFVQRYDTSCRESIEDLKALVDITSTLIENYNYSAPTYQNSFSEGLILKLIDALIYTATYNCGYRGEYSHDYNVGGSNANGGLLGGNNAIGILGSATGGGNSGSSRGGNNVGNSADGRLLGGNNAVGVLGSATGGGNGGSSRRGNNVGNSADGGLLGGNNAVGVLGSATGGGNSGSSRGGNNVENSANGGLLGGNNAIAVLGSGLGGGNNVDGLNNEMEDKSPPFHYSA